MLSSKVQVLVKALVLLMLFSSVAIPQDNTRTCGLIQKGKIVRQIDADSKVLYATPEDNIVFGYYSLTTNPPERKYRSIYEVALPGDLPAGALFTKVELIYKNNGNYSGEKFAIYNIPISSYDNTWGESKRWEITESGSFLHEFAVYGSSMLTVGFFPLQEIANEALQAGKTKLYLGFRAYPESGPYETRINNFASLSIKFTYEIVVRHTLNNSNGSGKIDVNVNNQGFYEVNSGYVLMVTAGSTVQLRAKEEQFDGSHYWVWNQDPNTLEGTKSIWTDENNDLASLNREFTYITDKNEIYKNFTAHLKRKFLVNRIDKTEFDGNFQTNDLARVVEQNSINVPFSETLTKTTGTYNFAGWEDGGGPLRTPTDNTTYTALYKMPQKSNTRSAFSNSSQRKFIRTPNDGYYHLVYESMGKIWYERSIDGVNWTLGNNGKPLNTDYVYDKMTGQTSGTGIYTTAKHPSVDYCNGKVFVAFQEQSGTGYRIRIATLENGIKIGRLANDIPFTTTYGQYSEDVYPEIAIKDDGHAAVALRRNDLYLKGLEVHYIMLYLTEGTSKERTYGWIQGTDQNTGVFTLATDRNSTDKFHIAWEQGGSIQYAKLNFTYTPGDLGSPNSSMASQDNSLLEIPPDGSWDMNQLETINVSNATSTTSSFQPSMIAASDGTARLAFKGYEEYEPGAGDGWYFTLLVNPDNTSWIPYLNKYGGEVFSPQISLGSETYFVGWTELYDYSSYRTVCTDASTLRDMEFVQSASGRDIQINMGGTRAQQFAMGFNSESSTLPYSFRQSAAIGTIVANKTIPVSNGRGVYLTKDDRQLYFIMGNVNAGGMNVNFAEVKDSVRLEDNIKKVNSYLQTEPFSLKENSTLSFAIRYGARDSAAASRSMKKGEFATFKLDLIDDATERVVGSYLDEKVDKDNIFRMKESVMRLKSEGLEGRLLRLRLSVGENMKSRYTISDLLMGGGLPLSKSIKEKDLNSSVEVREYSLSQNYPNPFNPSTLISYALPKASKVSLKVYDILGKEVATLVNGYLEMGKYSVEFNASSLPSGIYIYEIRANDFVKSGKMMLLK